VQLAAQVEQLNREDP